MRVVFDVVVAGGGPAGLMTALHARRAGLSVLVVEPRAAPIDKACGEGLLPPAVRSLARVGVTVAGRTFPGITFSDGKVSATADFRHGHGLAVRRTELHAALYAAAASAGAEFGTGRIDRVTQYADHVRAGPADARYLVAADGLHSTLRRTLQLDGASRATPRWGLRAHFRCAPWSSQVRVLWSASAEAYVTPVSDDCVGVALLSASRGSFAERLQAFPELLDRLPDRPIDAIRGAGPLRHRTRRVAAGRVLFVGDAAGYVDALTGEGLSIAFACAEALVGRITSATPLRYERDYRALSRRYRWLTTALVAAASRPVLRRRIVPLAHKAPLLFEAAVDQLSR